MISNNNKKNNFKKVPQDLKLTSKRLHSIVIGVVTFSPSTYDFHDTFKSSVLFLTAISICPGVVETTILSPFISIPQNSLSKNWS